MLRLGVGGDISCSVISAFWQEEQGRDAVCYPDKTLLGSLVESLCDRISSAILLQRC
ncbi:MAG: hypothetical protein ACOC2Z_16545 [Coleofasciculus sp.]